MKAIVKIALLLFALCCPAIASAQYYGEVVFKNGEKMEGYITLVPDQDGVRIDVLDGNIFSSNDNIESIRIFDEDPNMKRKKQGRPVSFSFRAGLNASMLGKVPAHYDTELREFNAIRHTAWPGVQFGILYDIPLKSPLLVRFSVQTGLFYAMKGVKINNRKEERKYSCHYLELPVWAACRYAFNKRVALQLHTGPYISAGSDFRYYYKPTNKMTESEEGDLIRRLGFSYDVGWNFGAGVTYRMLYFGVQYDMGFRKTWEHWEQQNTENPLVYRFRNQTIGICVGYKLW